MIKAIETIYKGYKFRSRLEARWAVFFDSAGIEWEYEKEGYDLGECGWYLPDFEITLKDGTRWFWEVKGNKEDDKGLRKARYLDNHCPEEFMGCLISPYINNDAITKYYPNESPDRNLEAITAQLLGVSNIEYNRAISKARQARFEHGEQG